MDMLSTKNYKIDSLPDSSKDFIVQFLCSQVNTLKNVQTHIEEGNTINGYVQDKLKGVEKNLKGLRKLCF